MQKNKMILLITVIMLSILLSVILLGFLYLKLTFKTNYKNIIEENLQAITINNQNLNTNLVLSIIKQESSFNKNARSSKDAFGLMQLTFPTASEQAKKLNLNITIEDLFNPEINIKLGINYLNYLFTIFDDKQLVILSYNAGFNKVKNWLEHSELKIVNGVYQTPYKETNNYINKVLTYEKIYNFL